MHNRLTGRCEYCGGRDQCTADCATPLRWGTVAQRRVAWIAGPAVSWVVTACVLALVVVALRDLASNGEHAGLSMIAAELSR